MLTAFCLLPSAWRVLQARPDLVRTNNRYPPSPWPEGPPRLMQESLYDRFRPFKPYDLALAVLILGLLAARESETTWSVRVVMVGIGVILFVVLEIIQRRVRVPTPLWQALAIVGFNTIVVTLLQHY